MGSIKNYIKKQGGLWASGPVDILFFVFLLAIVTIGLVMLYSSTYPYAYYHEGNSAYYFTRQLQAVGIGFVAMLLISKINYKIFRDIGAHVGTLVSWGLLILARMMPAYQGTHRWVYFGSLQMQPSDLAKLTLILTLAMWLDKYHSTVVSKRPMTSEWAKKINSFVGKPVMNDSVKIIVICGGITACYAGLVLLGSHLSGTLLMLFVGVIMMVLGEIRWKWFVIGGAALVLLLVLAYQADLLKDYMSERIVAWRDKDYDPLGVRWQTNQALYAIGSGGLFGKGIGNSTQKYLYVSEPQNDMIFSIVVEELGFVGAALIILLYALLVWRGVVIGVNAENRYGALVAMGIVFQLAVQVILNIAVATDSIPNTGISLPFFSYGRTSMIMNMAAMGFVMSISRTARIKRR
ncbi:MAG: FtsW/RodA/SpoVE family cell cycle protein [Clostridia bacterium]|nr:FtsW/RodA/SpoVE family cell cycle protein [Clostridia bacterium]